MCANGRCVVEGTPDELREQTGADDLEEVFVRVLKNAGLLDAAMEMTSSKGGAS